MPISPGTAIAVHPIMKPVTYPLFTVVVFQGAPSSNALTEAYRRSFESQQDALRYARNAVTNARMDWAGTGRTYFPPCASVFEDSPSRGIGRHVAERNSRARARYLRSVAAQCESAARSGVNDRLHILQRRPSFQALAD